MACSTFCDTAAERRRTTVGDHRRPIGAGEDPTGVAKRLDRRDAYGLHHRRVDPGRVWFHFSAEQRLLGRTSVLFAGEPALSPGYPGLSLGLRELGLQFRDPSADDETGDALDD